MRMLKNYSLKVAPEPAWSDGVRSRLSFQHVAPAVLELTFDRSHRPVCPLACVVGRVRPMKAWISCVSIV